MSVTCYPTNPADAYALGLVDAERVNEARDPLTTPWHMEAQTAEVQAAYWAARKGQPMPGQIPMTPAQQLLTLNALEVAIGDLMERSDVLAAGEVCNLLCAALGMEPVSYWDDSD